MKKLSYIFFHVIHFYNKTVPKKFAKFINILHQKDFKNYKNIRLVFESKVI